MVNLIGHGFIGSHYARMFPTVINERNDLRPQCQQVFYTISTTDNYNMQINPYIDIETNLITLVHALEKCRGQDVVFNFASSWFVYGNAPSPYTEDSYCDPQGFYSITKRTAEQLLISYCGAHGLKYRIMRFANVVGPGDAGVSAKKNVLTHLIRRIKHNEPIELLDGGNFYRDYIHVEDLCRAVNLVITQGEVNTVYNIGNGTPTRFRDAIDYAIQRTGSTSTVTVRGTGVPEVKHMNVDRLRALGYKPEWTVERTLDDLIARG